MEAKQALKRKSPGSEEQPPAPAQQETSTTEQDKVQTAPPHKKNKTQPTKPIVQLDSAKPALIIRQKPIELAEVSNQIKKTLVAVTEELESSTSQIQQLSPSQANLIACLVHESDKPLSELTSYVHSKLLPQTKLLIDHEPSEKPFDPLPLSVIETVINQVARRINYAPVQADIDWLPPNLPKAFQIWRWESNDRESVIPADLKEISQKRWAERQLIKPQICTILSELDSSEREALLRKFNPGRRKSVKNDADGSTPKSTQPSKCKPPSSSQEVICLTPTTPKSRAVDTEENGDQVLTEKELIKRQREQKRKEKEDAKLAAERQKKKMGSLMSGWMSKGNNTPRATTKINKQSDSKGLDETQSHLKNGAKVDASSKASSSDFEKTFRPFHLKPQSQLAPINRFRSSHQPDSDPDQHQPGSLTHQECLDQFLNSMRSKKNNSAVNQKDKKRITTVKEVVNGIAESELTGCIDGAKKWRRALQNRWIIPVKFLRFHEDVRPGYIGTWSKTSRLVSGRNPFGKDTCLLDYDYDSEADWNEEDGEGEDLEQSDGGEGMSSEITDSDEDGWLVEDDDEIEMVDDGQIHASNRALDFRTDDDHQLDKSNKKIAGLARRKVVGPLIPVIKGPIWEDALGLSNNMLEPFRIQMINGAPLGLNPFVYEPQVNTKANRPKLSTVGFKPPPAILPLPESANQMKNNSTDLTIQAATLTTMKSNEENLKENEKQAGTSIRESNLNLTNFPNELIPEMIKYVNGNKKSKPILIEDLKNLFLENFQSKVSKRSIEKALNLFAVKVAGTWRIIDPSPAPPPSNP